MLKWLYINVLNLLNIRISAKWFLTRYYSDKLRDIFLSAYHDIEKAGTIFNTRPSKKSTEFVNEVFNNIREAMSDDRNFDFNSESDIKAFGIKYDKMIIPGNDWNIWLQIGLRSISSIISALQLSILQQAIPWYVKCCYLQRWELSGSLSA